MNKSQVLAKFWECECEFDCVHLKVESPMCLECGITVEDVKGEVPDSEGVECALSQRAGEILKEVWDLKDALRERLREQATVEARLKVMRAEEVVS